MPEIDRRLAPAKLTRTFRVIGRRNDGYHLIEAEMVELDLADELEFTVGDGLEVVDAVRWVGRGVTNPVLSDVPVRENLVVRALELAGRAAHVRLLKRIPPGGGLGGGSADAAAVLRWAGVEDLALAARLGADVPFCLRGGRAMVRGVGEVLEPLDPVEATFVLVTPSFGVPTAAVYAAFDEVGSPDSGSTTNDLEKAALVVEPQLAQFRGLLAAISRRQPSLAGSGATWFVECAPEDAQAIAAGIRNELATANSCALVTVARAII